MALPVPEGNTQAAIDDVEAQVVALQTKLAQVFEGYYQLFEDHKARLAALEAAKAVYDAAFAAMKAKK